MVNVNKLRGALVVIENGENRSIDDGDDDQEHPRCDEHQWGDGEIKKDAEKRVKHGVVHSDLNYEEKRYAAREVHDLIHERPPSLLSMRCTGRGCQDSRRTPCRP